MSHLEECNVILMGRKAFEHGEDQEPPYGATDERARLWRMGWQWAADLRARRNVALAKWRAQGCKS